MDDFNINEVKWNKDGLICAIAQDVYTGEILMQAYMNEEALKMTIDTGFAYYYSRSRNCLWKKGETSGHVQIISKILYDCDCDCVLMLVEQIGAACHTGKRTCFYRTLKEFNYIPDYKVLFSDMQTIRNRAQFPKEGSYTNYLLDKGVEKICKKIGEEASETIIAAVSNKSEDLVGELCDLMFHSMVLMQSRGLSLRDIFGEMEKRKGLKANPKYKDNNISSNRDMIKNENKD